MSPANARAHLLEHAGSRALPRRAVRGIDSSPGSKHPRARRRESTPGLGVPGPGSSSTRASAQKPDAGSIGSGLTSRLRTPTRFWDELEIRLLRTEAEARDPLRPDLPRRPVRSLRARNWLHLSSGPRAARSRAPTPRPVGWQSKESGISVTDRHPVTIKSDSGGTIRNSPAESSSSGGVTLRYTADAPSKRGGRPVAHQLR